MAKEINDPFLDGNELIEQAIEHFNKDRNNDNLFMVLEAIRTRMHADGHFIFPVFADEEDPDSFAFRSLQSKDGKVWNAAFTSQAEYEKGEPSEVISNFIDSTLKLCLESQTDGFIINPWGNSFLLSKEFIQMIFKMDGNKEYSVPDDPITPELLEDGSFLKRAISICNSNKTQLNLMKLARILRDSYVWIPCTAVFSEADNAKFVEALAEAEENKEGLDSLIGETFTASDQVRLIPDILTSNDHFFFPVFTTAEEMGEYGEHFSKVEKHFLEAMILAKNNEKDVTGIVINPFSEPFVIPKEMFEVIAETESGMKEENRS